MSVEADHLTLTDVARLAEVRLSAVSNWRTRYSDFPKPHVESGQELFVVTEVAQWLRKRKISRNRLKPDEPPGTSYGDRFVRGAGLADQQAATATGHEVDSASGWESRLWDAMGALRGTHDIAFSLEFLLCLVYVKTQRTDVWQSAVNASDWSTVRDLFSEVSLQVGEDDPAIPVFPALAHTDDRSLLDAVRVIDTIHFGKGEGPESTSARISETILANIERGMGKSGGHFTPPDVARCLVELLDPRSTDSVYDPFCGSGELLSATAVHVSRRSGSLRGWQVYGQTPQQWSWLTSRMNLVLHEVNADLSKPGSAIEVDRFPEQKFSRILANPPFNVHGYMPQKRTWPFGEPPSSNANFAWLQHVVTKLAPGGRAAVVMPIGAAFTNTRSESQIRKAMIDTGVVECVISLPPGLFRFTAIPTMVWILRGVGEAPTLSETLFIEARGLGEVVERTKRRLGHHDIERIVNEYRRWRDRRAGEDFTGTDGFSAVAGHDEISENDHILTPGRYVEAVAERPDTARGVTGLSALRSKLDELTKHAEEISVVLDAQLMAATTGEWPGDNEWSVPLGTVCDVLPGPGSVSRSGSQPSWTPLVLPRNIRDNRIGSKDLDVVPPATADRLARYRLIAGDIVSARTGTLGRYGRMLAEQDGWLLGPGCVRFRPNDQVDSDYLTYYLGSPGARQWLTEHTTGSVIPNINAPTLRTMPVRLPPLSVQRAVVQILEPFGTAVSIHHRISATNKELQELLVQMLMSPITAPVVGSPAE